MHSEIRIVIMTDEKWQQLVEAAQKHFKYVQLSSEI